MRTQIAVLALSVVGATFSLTAQQPTPPPARVPLAESGDLAGRLDDRLCLGRRPLDGAGRGGRRAPPGVGPGH